MGRIPTFQPTIIQPQQTQTQISREPVIRSATEFATTTAKIALAFKQAKDTSQVARENARFKSEIMEDWARYKIDNVDNTDNFAKDWEIFYNEKQKQFVENENLSKSARSVLDETLTNARGGWNATAIGEQDKIQTLAYTNNIENSAEFNNTLAYRGGQGFDFDTLTENEKILNSNIVAGSTLVSSEQLEKSRITQTQNVYKNWFDGAIETDPQEALNLLDTRDYDQKLGADNLKALRAKADRRIKIKNDLIEKENKRYNEYSRVMSALNGEILLDPKTKDDRDAVNTFWEIQSEQHDNEQVDIGVRMQDANFVAEKTGIIPAQVQTTTSALLFNGDPAQQVLASDFISDITNDKPRVAEQYDSKTRAFAESIQINLRAGVEQDQAIRWARNSIDENLKQTLDFRQKEYNKPKKIQNDVKKMESDLRPFFGDLEIGDEVLSDFADLQQKYFMNEGVDRETAYELAQKDIKNLYAVTEIGKKRYMKYAPERYYGQEVQEIYGVKPDWIKKQVVSDVFKTEDRFFETEKQRKQFIDGISLGVNPDSTIGGGNPTYFVFSENEFGGLEMVINEQNQPMTYIPDFRRTEDYKKITEQIKKETKTPEDIRNSIQEMREEQRFKNNIINEIQEGGVL